MKILYFVDGNPTTEQLEEAKKNGAMIRNSNAFHDDDFLEKCDKVMGVAPKAYTDKFENIPVEDKSEDNMDEKPEEPKKQTSKNKKEDPE